MNIRDMHIEVNQSLQKVASNRTRKFLPEEIDWVLNKMADRFINFQLEPATGGEFQSNQLDITKIKNLIVDYVTIPVIDTSTPVSNVMIDLPYNYVASVSVLSKVNSCNSLKSATTNQTIYTTKLKLAQSNNAEAPYYTSFIISCDTISINLPSDLSSNNQYKGYQDKQDIELLIDWIVLTLNKRLSYNSKDTQISFEDGYFIAKSISHQPILTLNIDGIDVTYTEFSSELYQSFVAGSNEVWRTARVLSSDTVDNYRNLPYYATNFRAPISEIKGNTLFVQYDRSYTISSLYLKYIRKPIPMSIILGTDCELDSGFHMAICDLATEYLLGRLMNPQGEQIIERDNMLRVTL